MGLRYDSATQLLTYSSHFWLHLTNMYMLLVRSIKDLLDPRDPSRVSNIGNVGRTGADKCNAAVIEAKHAFRKGTSEKGMELMQAFRQAQLIFVEEVSHQFLKEYEKFLYMV